MEKQSAERGETRDDAVQNPVALPHAAADALRDSLLQHDPELPMNVQRNLHQVQSGVDSLTAAQSRNDSAVPVGSAGVNVKAGKALPMFDAISWAYSFVEFFHGDTVPNHPLRTSHGKNNSHFKSVGWQRHFATLAVREELEYTLDSDAVPYKARQMSRFDTPEFMMIFASTLRSMHMLQSSRLSILNGNLAHTFWADLKTIAECKVDDFERVFSQQQWQGAQTLIQVFQSPKLSEEHRTVHTALKQLLMQTATVPLTEGNKQPSAKALH